MFYHALKLDEPLYRIGYRETAKFPEHKHHEIELFYCYEGTYNIIIDRTPYKMHKGDLAIIGSMLSHEIPDTNSGFNSKCMVIEAGPAMFGKTFSLLASAHFNMPIFSLSNDKHLLLYNLLEETNYYRQNRDNASHLIIKGNIYKIFAYIIGNLIDDENPPSKENIAVINIENALEHIYNCYDSKITIECVANLCGYSKTNFCKIFKNITGETFHNMLNNHRIKMAKILLAEPNLSVEEVAIRTGFGDTKNFYRVFKQIVGMSPGSYKMTNIQQNATFQGVMTTPKTK